MKTTFPSAIAALFFLTAAAACGDADPPGAPPPDLRPPLGSTRYGIFEGKVPCDGCEKIKTRLTLHRSAQDNRPTTYVLERVSVGIGNERLIDTGAWTTSSGSRVDPNSTVAMLDGGPEGFANYMMVGPNLLLMLDGRREPRVGNAVYSFTLSRTDAEP